MARTAPIGIFIEDYYKAMLEKYAYHHHHFIILSKNLSFTPTDGFSPSKTAPSCVTHGPGLGTLVFDSQMRSPVGPSPTQDLPQYMPEPPTFKPRPTGFYLDGFL